MRAEHNLTCLLLVGVLAAALGGLPAAGDAAAAAADRSDYEWFDPIIVVRRAVLDGFYEQPDEETLKHAMIDAMINALDDPYTLFIPPAAEADFNKALRGTYVGIGAEVNVVDDYLTIVSPLEDSPALEAGVMAGDIVLEIAGMSTQDRSIDQCIEQLLGEPGTPVTIRVRHLDGVEEPLTIVRQHIVTRTVKGLRRHGEAWSYWADETRSIGYVRVTQFVDGTLAELAEALGQLQEGGLRGLVLDLRGNPGGELGVAIEMANLFLDDGTIVSVRGRNRRPQSWQAEAPGTLADFPMIVLVNRYSASASEIVAGALQENGRAKVVGTRTFGKGSVQEVIDLPYEQGTLKLTSGHYYLPSGRNISRQLDSAEWGVDPDDGLVVGMSEEGYRDMILARRQYEVIRPDRPQEPGNFADPTWIRDAIKDEQLAVAMEALQTRLDRGTWPVLGHTDPTQLALDQRIDVQARLRRRLLDQLQAVEDRLLTLHNLADEAGRPPLVPADADLTEGLITVRDRDGNLVGTFRIDSGDLEFALRQVRLTPVEPGD